MTDLRVLVVAQDMLARAGLAVLLGELPGCSVVGQLAEEPDLESAKEVYDPDAVVWDLGWNPAQSLERLAALPDRLPPVLALVADDSHVGQAWSAGARAILLREADAESLLSALSAVAKGLVVFDAGLSAALPPLGGPAPSQETDLTPREMEVLRLLTEGLPNKAIASRLGISEHTVKFHVNSIMGKLGAQSRTEAVTRATRLGLILL